MGFKQVYSSLVDVFPQIDSRVLRAVAIEHSKDVDAACEAVLTEIIPFMTLRSTSGSLLSQSLYEGQSSEGVVVPTQTMDNPVGSAEGQNCHDADVYNVHLEGESSNIMGSVNIDTQSHGEYIELVNKDGLTTLQDEDIELVNKDGLTTLQDEEIGADQNMNNLVLEKVGCGDSETNSCTDLVLLSPVENDDVQLAVVPDMHVGDVEELEKSLSNMSSIVGTEYESSTLNASMSQSSQIPNMEALEEIIVDAGNNKKTLFSAMESVISMMRKVELREQAAEQAKLEVAKVGADMLAELKTLKQSLQQAEESNSRHAGDVYGEKAILATELRELQSRVLSLSDERDKSLTVLDEMRQTLEVRLAAAENEIKSAEQEKLEKEKAAMKALADHELIMEEVVQDSKLLKQQAEENAKLQEFLTDRGRVVDMLQGEIAVICKDVRLLKESFDDNVPFSKSLSSSQTSFILASSTSSSSKNLNPEELATPGGADPLVITESERDAVSCFAQQSFEGESSTGDYRKELVDDGWELFDDREVFA
ncbi:hypothetical protein PHJA_000344300 [Phtheirospermum japonicum]|uniref:CUE domain-containing protein n=1 Tax=Phtheirospermum japonicum TaxID=374723 RepID=A0A830B2X2_9LAMI|nr:hypothetical protein PHJA_000344300 [Phtheirospermum japonicum]